MQQLIERLGGGWRALVVAPKHDLGDALAALPLHFSRADHVASMEVYAQAALDLVIVDGASFAPTEWIAARDGSGLSHLPALVVEASPETTEDESVAYGAADTVRRPIRPSELARRATLLGETTRNRQIADLAGVVINASVSGITIVDGTVNDHPIVFANAVFERITGYTAAEVLGKNLRLLQGPDTDRDTTQRLAHAILLGRPVDARILNYRKDGTPFWNAMAIRPVRDSGGQLRYFIGILHDVTAMPEEHGGPAGERTHSPLFMDLILEELPAGVLTADRARRVTFVNRLGLRTLGLESTNNIGKQMSEVLHLPADLMPSSDVSHRSAYALPGTDGEIELGVTMTPTLGLHPDIHWFVLFRDMTSTRGSELAARRVERLAAIGTMVAGFAHEVRNPVTTMRSLIEQLDEETPAPDPRRVVMGRLLRHLERIERLVKTSLKFGCPEVPRPARVAPFKIVEDALEQVSLKTKNLGPISRELHPDVPPIWVDEGQLVQVLVALLNNAVEAAAYPDQVKIRLDAPTDPHGQRYVRFEVRDNGPGMNSELLNRIFDPFYTTKAGGTGLGLSIAQRLVHDNGGRLEVRSSPGAGAVFTVSFSPAS